MGIKKYLPYILLLIALFIVAGFYIDKQSRHNKLMLGTPPETANNPPATADQTKASTQNQTTIEKIKFQNLGPAPELTGIDHWLNSDPLTIKGLKGKVVLIDFWTYTCINCVRTLPYVTKWYDTYKDKGFVIIGVHTPEFGFEKDTNNVADAIKHFNIHYPVAQDNEYATWNAYNNQYWPAEYLIDKNGNIVYTHFGEGQYDHTENAILQLLGMDDAAKHENGQDLSQVKSPEMYFGTERLEYLGSSQAASTQGKFYTTTGKPALNNFEMQGYWQFSPDHAALVNNPKGESGGQIVLRFHSSKVYMVAKNQKPITITTIVDGKNVKTTEIFKSQLYTVFESDTSEERTLIIDASGSGLEVFTFTFG